MQCVMLMYCIAPAGITFQNVITLFYLVVPTEAEACRGRADATYPLLRDPGFKGVHGRVDVFKKNIAFILVHRRIVAIEFNHNR